MTEDRRSTYRGVPANVDFACLEAADDIAEVILDADCQYVTINFCTGRQARAAVTGRASFIEPDDLNSQQDFNYGDTSSMI